MFYRLCLVFIAVVSFSGCSHQTESVEAAAPVVVAPSPAPSPAAAPVARRAVAKSASSGSKSSSSSTAKFSRPGKKSPPPQAGILTAGEIDDNLNLAAFQRYVKNIKSKKGNKKLQQYPTITDHNDLHIQVVDSSGRGVSNARLKIARQTFYTRTDGHFYFYPEFEIPQLDKSKITVSVLSANSNSTKVIKKFLVNTTNKGLQKIVVTGQQNILPKALDLMFVIDTTGSMGDELRYIKSELKGIIKRVRQLHPETEIRYGLTVYRDKTDAYVVRNYPFQNSLEKMLSLLSKQSANGGGDYPEAMDAAVQKAVNANWGTGNRARLMFLIADAPPHASGVASALQAAKIAHQKGIRIYPLGASGVADEAEYIMRNMALVSNGRYQFLTDDSGVGNSHQEPHVACYVVTRLNQLISRTISSELSGRRVEPSKNEMLRSVGQYDNGVCHSAPKKVSG